MADDDKRDDRANLQPRANPPMGWIVDGNGSFVRSTRPDRNYDTAADALVRYAIPTPDRFPLTQS
jgi:hypothetical protein